MPRKKPTVVAENTTFIDIIFHVAVNEDGSYEVLGGDNCSTFEEAINNYDLGASVTEPVARLSYRLRIPRERLVAVEPFDLGVAP